MGKGIVDAAREFTALFLGERVACDQNLGGTVEDLRIFPSDDSRVSLPFNEKYSIKSGATDDEDFRDILVLRIDLSEFDEFGDVPPAAQDINAGLLPAEHLKVGAVLWIIGYPAETNDINYEEGRIKNSRAVIRAIYQGCSSSDHCHVASANSSLVLESFDGLSGSPVFYLNSVWHNGQELIIPRVVGMVLRGTASSGRIHFVSAKVIEELISLASDGIS